MTDVSPRRLALALAPGTLLAGVAGGIVFPIFPIVGTQVGLALWFIGLILAANRAVRVVTAPFIGMLADSIGGRRTLLVGLAVQILVVAMYIGGLVTHHEGAMFLSGRLLHGLGSGCVFVSAQALALQAGGPNRSGAAAGIVRASIVLGVPIGFVLGGLLSGWIGVIPTFEVAGAAVVFALIGAYITVPDLRATFAKRPSLMQTLTAMRDIRLLRIGGLNFALNFAAGGMLLTTLALLVKQEHLSLFGSDTPGTSGLFMGEMSIIDALATPFLGALGDRLDAHAKIAKVSAFAVVVGLVVIGLFPATIGVGTGIAFVGLGAAGLGPSVLVMMGAIVPPERRGTGAGILQLCGDAGGMLGPLVGTALFTGNTALPYFLTAAIVGAIALLA